MIFKARLSNNLLVINKIALKKCRHKILKKVKRQIRLDKTKLSPVAQKTKRHKQNLI
jgi:hypothetical protein